MVFRVFCVVAFVLRFLPKDFAWTSVWRAFFVGCCLFVCLFCVSTWIFHLFSVYNSDSCLSNRLIYCRIEAPSRQNACTLRVKKNVVGFCCVACSFVSLFFSWLLFSNLPNFFAIRFCVRLRRSIKTPRSRKRCFGVRKQSEVSLQDVSVELCIQGFYKEEETT